jgi:hypothetical protein
MVTAPVLTFEEVTARPLDQRPFGQPLSNFRYFPWTLFPCTLRLDNDPSIDNNSAFHFPRY